MEKEKIQVGIYCIDKSLFDGINDNQIINQIITVYNKKVRKTEEHFIEQPLGDNLDINNFVIKIFYSTKTSSPNWKTFIKPLLKENTELLKGLNRDISFIAFAGKDDHLFAISGGQGNFAIQGYINRNFGIDIIARVISKNKEVIKSLEERGLTGSILASTKFFRGDHKLADEDEFGKIYKLIKADLDQEILGTLFGFSEEELKHSSGCVAKSSFQINKSINIKRLIGMLDCLIKILKMPLLLKMNKVVLIDNRGEKNKRLMMGLKEALWKEVYDYYVKGGEIDFDFCNSKYAEYSSADKYIVCKGQSEKEVFERDRMDNCSIVLSDIKSNCEVDDSNLDVFIDELNSLSIRTIDDQGKIITKDRIIDHIHGEITYQKATYFWIDSNWYQISSDFLKELNDDCQNLIEGYLDNSLLMEKYDVKNNDKEDDYIIKHFKEKHIVLHRHFLDNIELCDILKYDKNNCYLIHVKRGFNNSMRDLTSQIYIAAQRLYPDIKGNNKYEYLKKYYQRLKSYSTSDNPYFKKISKQVMPENEFLKLFEKEIYFCLAFVDESKNERDVTSIKKFDSNIAKYCLIELGKNLSKIPFKFKIIQIKQT